MDSVDSPITLSPHVELLFLSARSTPSAAAAQRIKEVAEGCVNWGAFVDLAAQHHVAPMVRHNLVDLCADRVPAYIRRDLDQRFAINARRSLYLLSTLLDIMRALDAARVPTICFKGPLLARTAYGDIALRQAGDLDVLVAPADVPRAQKVLRTSEFRPMVGERALAPEAYRFETEFTFVRDRDDVTIDLHCHAAGSSVSMPLQYRDLKSSCQSMIFGGTTIQSIKSEALLLLLCVHGMEHCWSELRWVCDVDALVVGQDSFDWGWVFREARRLHMERKLSFGLLLAHECFDTSYPEEVWQRAQLDSGVVRLAGRSRHRLVSEVLQTPTVWDQVILLLQSWDRSRDAFRFAYHTATDPRPRDWQIISVPRVMYPVYHLLRPLRLTCRYRRQIVEGFPALLALARQARSDMS